MISGKLYINFYSNTTQEIPEEAEDLVVKNKTPYFLSGVEFEYTIAKKTKNNQVDLEDNKEYNKDEQFGKEEYEESNSILQLEENEFIKGKIYKSL